MDGWDGVWEIGWEWHNGWEEILIKYWKLSFDQLIIRIFGGCLGYGPQKLANYLFYPTQLSNFRKRQIQAHKNDPTRCKAFALRESLHADTINQTRYIGSLRVQMWALYCIKGKMMVYIQPSPKVMANKQTWDKCPKGSHKAESDLLHPFSARGLVWDWY